MQLIKRPIIVPKPKIFKHPSFGKIKFSEKLKSDPEINKTETAFLILPGKKGMHEIGINRKKTSLNIDEPKVEAKLKEFAKKMNLRGIINLEKKGSIILHTHILDYKKGIKGKEKYVALPSLSDIKHLILTFPKFKQAYEIIGVFDTNRNECGYTTIKITPQMQDIISKKNNIIINDKLYNQEDGKEILYSHLSRQGLEIYFTPMPGYKLDKNFNYVKDK